MAIDPGEKRVFRLGEQRVHTVHVELERVDSKQVSRRFRHEQVRPELLAELGDEVLERRRGRPRGLLAPERIDQAIGRDRAARIDE